jgi:hypothetical protein
MESRLHARIDAKPNTKIDVAFTCYLRTAFNRFASLSAALLPVLFPLPGNPKPEI